MPNENGSRRGSGGGRAYEVADLGCEVARVQSRRTWMLRVRLERGQFGFDRRGLTREGGSCLDQRLQTG